MIKYTIVRCHIENLYVLVYLTSIVYANKDNEISIIINFAIKVSIKDLYDI